MVRYDPGRQITVSKPFVYALNSNFRGLQCDFCFKSSDQDNNVKLKKCSCCKVCFFCDRGCQRSAWKGFHKEECSRLSSLQANKSPTETFIFFTRLILKVLKNRDNSITEEVCSVKRSFNDLEAHVNELKVDFKRLEQLELLSCFVKSLFPELALDDGDLLSAFGKMVVNSYTIYNNDVPVGTGLYLGASIFNHSCDPNSITSFTGTTLTVRSIKQFEFQSHHDVRISYIDPIDTSFERQSLLEEQYYFSCQCSACLNQTMDDTKTEVLNEEKSSDIIAQSSEFLKDVVPKRSSMNDDEKRLTLESCEKYLHLVKGILGEGHILRIGMLDLCFDLCIDLQLWSESLTFALPSLEYYRKYYSRYYPATGIQLFKIAKVQSLLDQPVEAECNFREARELLTVSYGHDHAIINDLDMFLYSDQVEHWPV